MDEGSGGVRGDREVPRGLGRNRHRPGRGHPEARSHQGPSVPLRARNLPGGRHPARRVASRREKEPLPAVCNQIAQLQPSRAGLARHFLYLSVAGIQQALQGQIGGAVETARDAAREARKRAAEQGLFRPERQAGNAAAQQILSQFQAASSRSPSGMGSPRFPASTTVFVSRVVFAEGQPGTPKERFGYLFPNKGAAQIIVRLRPDLTDQSAMTRSASRRSPTRDWIERTSGTSSPESVVVDAGARELRDQVLILLGVAGLVMALTLLLIPPRPLRLRPRSRRGGVRGDHPGSGLRLWRIAHCRRDRDAAGARRTGGGLRDPQFPARFDHRGRGPRRARRWPTRLSAAAW